jgi:hypothetical protein
MNHARAVRRLFPGLAIQYWQEAIERSGRRASERLVQALEETAGTPATNAIWEEYIREHPALVLTYARTLPDAERIFRPVVGGAQERDGGYRG